MRSSSPAKPAWRASEEDDEDLLEGGRAPIRLENDAGGDTQFIQVRGRSPERQPAPATDTASPDAPDDARHREDRARAILDNIDRARTIRDNTDSSTTAIDAMLSPPRMRLPSRSQDRAGSRGSSRRAESPGTQPRPLSTGGGRAFGGYASVDGRPPSRADAASAVLDTVQQPGTTRLPVLSRSRASTPTAAAAAAATRPPSAGGHPPGAGGDRASADGRTTYNEGASADLILALKAPPPPTARPPSATKLPALPPKVWRIAAPVRAKTVLLSTKHLC